MNRRLSMLERGDKLPVQKGKCRVCLEPLPKKRRGYCSDECRDNYLLATSTEFLRFKVYERDKGICAYCALDCDELEIRVWGYSTMAKRLRRSYEQRAIMRPREERQAKVDALKANGFPRMTAHPKTLWEAEHTVPLADGGGYGLDNVTTCCVACHANKTSDEATWRAKRRKLVGRKQTATLRRFKKMGIV